MVIIRISIIAAGLGGSSRAFETTVGAIAAVSGIGVAVDIIGQACAGTNDLRGVVITAGVSDAAVEREVDEQAFL